MTFNPGDYVNISESDVYANAQVVKVKDGYILVRLLSVGELEDNLKYGGGDGKGKKET